MKAAAVTTEQSLKMGVGTEHKLGDNKVLLEHKKKLGHIRGLRIPEHMLRLER